MCLATPSALIAPRRSTDARLSLIDAVRALAALAVFSFHISPHVTQSMNGVLRHGWLGVQVFFAVSGFVIARTLRDAVISPQFALRFIVRRIIRLDPAYWVTILLAIGLLLASNQFFSDRQLPLPSGATFVAHFFYAQDILGFGNIVDVFWSLCIEFQFYTAFVVILGVLQFLQSQGQASGIRRVLGASLSRMILLSLMAASLVATHYYPVESRPWLSGYWNQFFAGALAAWVLSGKAAWQSFAALGLLLGISTYWNEGNPCDLTAYLTAATMFVSGRMGWLSSGLNYSLLQWFGRLTYSFYLVHTLVLSRLSRLTVRLEFDSTTASWLVCAGGFLLSLSIASLLYYTVEMPSLMLAQRLKRRTVA